MTDKSKQVTVVRATLRGEEVELTPEFLQSLSEPEKYALVVEYSNGLKMRPYRFGSDGSDYA